MKVIKETSFVCSACGFDSTKWFGKCPSCMAWNTMQEFKVQGSKFKVGGRRRDSGQARMTQDTKPQRLSEIESVEFSRIPTGIEELDRVLGGGIVKGSVAMLAGEPGVGKSTLLLELVKNYGSKDLSRRPLAETPPRPHESRVKETPFESLTSAEKILYASGEESVEQIKGRAGRLGVEGENLYLMAETNIEIILEEVAKGVEVSPSFAEATAGREVSEGENIKHQIPSTKLQTNSKSEAQNSKQTLLIIDSIQTMYSDEIEGIAGSVSQVKYCTQKIIEVAKKTGITVMLVGHVTKEGEVAGPMMLAHMVDVVLFLEGERYADLRLLRGIKNRFGATDEVGVFRMADKGMEEVRNPSEVFLNRANMGDMGDKGAVGSVTTCAMEGTRPILTEIQALVTKSYSPMPRRVGMGVDNNRLNLLTAVLQKILKLPLWDQDIFVKVAGGFKISEPAADLAICQAIVSSFKNTPVPTKTVYFGEVGLLGEVRRVNGEEKRIKESKKLGLEKVFSSGGIRSIRELQ